MIGEFQIRLGSYPKAMQTKVLETMFEGWTRINCAYLVAHPETPPLYESGVRYRREGSPRGVEGHSDRTAARFR